MVDDEKEQPVLAFGRVVARNEENVYIDWHEFYGEDPLDMADYLERPHADPWPLTLFEEITRG